MFSCRLIRSLLGLLQIIMTLTKQNSYIWLLLRFQTGFIFAMFKIQVNNFVHIYTRKTVCSDIKYKP